MTNYHKRSKVSNEVLKRLENNHYAIERAYSQLEKAVNSESNKEIFAATGEMLLWLIATEDWHCRHNKHHKRNDFMQGMRHPYNSLKHNMTFINIHRKEGDFTFNSFEFPLVIPPSTITWASTDELNEYQSKWVFKNYKKYIEGKEVLETINEAISILNERKDMLKNQ